jgi:hypothetical protein
MLCHVIEAHMGLDMEMIRDGMVVGSTTICDKVCQLLATGRWFSPGPPASSTNITDRHDITLYYYTS